LGATAIQFSPTFCRVVDLVAVSGGSSRVYSLVGYFGLPERKIGAFDIIALYFGKLARAQFSLPVHRDAFKLDLL
jgi:hypothetical protein